MKEKDFDGQVWALAALLLACRQVMRLARQGEGEAEVMNTLFCSLMRFNCQYVWQYYDNKEVLKSGLRYLYQMFRQVTDGQVTTYFLQLLLNERRLAQKPALMRHLQEQLQELQRKSSYFDVNSEAMIQSYAQCYQHTAGRLRQRILVHGDARYLQDEAVIAQIRALLFCGIRAASLWRACGGRQWHLLFYRQKILQRAEQLSYEP